MLACDRKYSLSPFEPVYRAGWAKVQDGRKVVAGRHHAGEMDKLLGQSVK